MYAIIQTGGKQYRVTTGDVLNIEKIDGKKGDVVKFDKLLMVSDANKYLIGKPYVASADLTAEIVDDAFKGEKLLTIKYKKRKQYRRTVGHRQQYTRILITMIQDGQGGSEVFDAARKKEVLMKASVKTAVKKTAEKTTTEKKKVIKKK